MGKKTYKTCYRSHIIEHRSRNSARYCLFTTDFSTILTQKAIGTAYVVAPPSSTTDDSDGLAPSDTGVWTCRKAPALDRNSRVKRLIWVNNKTKEERDRWSRWSGFLFPSQNRCWPNAHVEALWTFLRTANLLGFPKSYTTELELEKTM